MRVSLAFALLTGVRLTAQTSPQTFFEEMVRPLLAENCYACHTEARSGGLRLDSRETLLAGGKSGAAIVPGDPDHSLLIAAVEHTHAKLRMPPGKKLTDAQIAALREWVKAGAPWPVSTVAAKPKRLWGLAPISAPRGSIDEWAKPRANSPDRATLIRRLHFDLTGLPPSYEQVRRFAADSSPDAYSRVVDALLASPQFGERWGRHWLDVARYAEDDVRGLGQATYPNAWRYRDWVIQAFNEDLPYDEFIRLQIAADLMPRPGKDDRAALGLFGLGPWYYSNAPPPEARADERHDRVDVLTRGFLGLTVACARCHDHKFDPISTKDYYALAGVFARTQYTEYPLAPVAEVQEWDRRKQRIDELEVDIKDFLTAQGRELSEILAFDTAAYLTGKGSLDPETQERWRKYLARPSHEHPYLEEWKKHPSPQAAARFQELVLAVMREKKEVDEDNEAALAPTRPKKNAPKTQLPNGFATYDEFCPGCAVVARALPRDRYMLWKDLFQPAEKKGGGILFYGSGEIEHFLQGPWKAHLEKLRAELARRKRELPARYPFLHGITERTDARPLRIHIRGSAYTLGEPAPQRFLEVCGGQPLDEGSGRRQLAEAISRNPQAARVAVNRIWGLLTGSYIVGSPSNFGTLGEKPSNPQLLEYLSARFVESGYSVKRLIREIVLSKTYQNETPRRRLDAESLRDGMLKVAGLWDGKTGGPSVDLSTDRARRCVYGKVSRFRLDDSLVLFDFPSPSITSEKRNVTVVPQQQLFLLNSPFVADAAKAIAAKTHDVREAYQMILSRDPKPEEMTAAAHFLQSGDYSEFAQVLLSSNEFLFVD
jgi:mono/diheme cytochrome c family protein